MSDYISHHGVEGQKWGVKHGPPYPLTPEAKKQAKKDLRAVNKEIVKQSRKYVKDNTSTKTKAFNLLIGGNIGASINAGKKVAEWAKTPEAIALYSQRAKIQEDLRRGHEIYNQMIQAHNTDLMFQQQNDLNNMTNHNTMYTQMHMM